MREKSHNSETFDFIVVGGGIAGSLLCYHLLLKDKKVAFFNHYYNRSASQIAAGIVKPITGRRLVKTWKVDMFLPYALSFYKNLEAKLGVKFLYQRDNIEVSSHFGQLNSWLSRSEDPDYAYYISGSFDIPSSWNIQKNVGGTILRHSFNVNTKKLCQAVHTYIQERISINTSMFEHNEIQIYGDHVQYHSINAQKIIFCEGAFVSKNTFFNSYPFQNVKGDVLTITSKSLPENYIISKGIFIVPWGNNTFKVGSTYDWNAISDEPQQEGKDELSAKLVKLIGSEFEIIDHQAGYRPSIKDRRPVIGFHPQYPCLGIFNGLGSKGVLMTPYIANHFSEVLCNNIAIEKDLDLKNHWFSS